MLRIAVPSDGPLHESTLSFMKSCGIGISRTNTRKYTAQIPSLNGVVVHFQRGADIPGKVEEGSADIGIVGKDRFLESKTIDSKARIIIEKLGYGHSELVLGIPDSWIDVESLSDLADLSTEFRQRGMDLRISTKYPRLVERFLITKQVNYFSLIPSTGTLEAAPTMGYADIIADISSTGTTLRENRLKTIHGGSVISSQACLISNNSLLATNTEKFALAKSVVERIEAHLKALNFCTVTANMKGDSADSISSYILQHGEISGLQGPTISQVFTDDGKKWFSVTVIIQKEKLLKAVELFRQIGGTSVIASEQDYIFDSECDGVARLAEIG